MDYLKGGRQQFEMVGSPAVNGKCAFLLHTVNIICD